MKLKIEIIDDFCYGKDEFDGYAYCTIVGTPYPAFSLPRPGELAEQPYDVETYESALARWIDDGHLCCSFDDSLDYAVRKEMDTFIAAFYNNVKHNLKKIGEAAEEEQVLAGIEVAMLSRKMREHFFPGVKVCSAVSADGCFKDQNGEYRYLKAKNPDYARIIRAIYPDLH
jgi:hypothetical protein